MGECARCWDPFRNQQQCIHTRYQVSHPEARTSWQECVECLFAKQARSTRVRRMKAVAQAARVDQADRPVRSDDLGAPQ
jgi:hypothetical protein